MAPKSAAAIPGALDLLIRKAVSQERWRAILTPYERPDNRRSLLQLAVTLVLYGAAWTLLLRERGGRLLGDRDRRIACRGSDGAADHHSARLQPRFLLHVATRV